MPFHFDITKPEHAYLFGFIQSDGHMSRGTRNRGKLRIEIQSQDRHLLESFQQIIPVSSSLRDRTRNTNFKDDYTTTTWTVCDQGFRASLHKLGLPYGPKSKITTLPVVSFSTIDYFRGLLDGDGSLGLTGQGFPFLGWCTSSPAMAQAILKFLLDITGKQKVANPNTRDGAYNLTVWKEDAQRVAQLLYYPGCLALRRKEGSASQVQAWVRPDGMREVTWSRRRWTPEDDTTVLNYDTDEAVLLLGRTASAIRTRRWRLRTAQASPTRAGRA